MALGGDGAPLAGVQLAGTAAISGALAPALP
jgi:hypothetical protein